MFRGDGSWMMKGTYLVAEALMFRGDGSWMMKGTYLVAETLVFRGGGSLDDEGDLPCS